MCEPTTLLAISTAISVASTAMSYIGQKQQAKNQERAATTAYNNDRAQLEEQRRQEGVSAREEMSQRGKDAMQARATLRAASADGGIGGNVVDRIMTGNEAAAGQDIAMMKENGRNTARQSGHQGIAMQSQAQSRLNAIERPSLLGTGLQIAGTVVGAKQQYNKIK